MKTMQSKICIFSLFFLSFLFTVHAAKLPVVNTKGVKVNQIVYVNPIPGRGNFTTISAAVAAAPINTPAGGGFNVIAIAKGVYNETVSIASYQTYIMLIGDGIGKTIITANNNPVDGNWTAYTSATLAVDAQGFVAKKLTIQNTAGPTKQQAVAARINGDSSAFYQCSFEGYQATLYAQAFRQFYKRCNIYGTVFFIWGDAAVVFQNSNIYARLPLPGQYNIITAQGRSASSENTGTVFQNSVVAAAPDLASSNSTGVQTFLGSPWQPYSTVVYMRTFLGSLIDPAGWIAWSGNPPPSTIMYGEYLNAGPGSVTTNRVNWPGFLLLNKTSAAPFAGAIFIGGKTWLPATGIPFF